MSAIHEGKRLVYLGNPRTASSSTCAALIEQLGFTAVGGQHDRLYAAGSVVTPETRGEWTVFETVRNHWDAVVSWVLRFYRGKPTDAPEVFGIAEVELYLLTSCRYVKPGRMWPYLEESDAVLRFENLDDDLNRLLESAGLAHVSLPHANVTGARRGRHYSTYYTDEARDYVAELYAGEIAEMGYTFEDRR